MNIYAIETPKKMTGAAIGRQVHIPTCLAQGLPERLGGKEMSSGPTC